MSKKYTKTKLFTFENNFHKTSCRKRARHNEELGGYWLNARQVRELKKALCGMSDCKCTSPRLCDEFPGWIVEEKYKRGEITYHLFERKPLTY